MTYTITIKWTAGGDDTVVANVKNAGSTDAVLRYEKANGEIVEETRAGRIDTVIWTPTQ